MAFTMKQGDRRPSFVVILKDNFSEPTEEAVDLTDATSAAFSMRESGGGTVKINLATATISNPAGGEITFDWGATDTDTVGDYEAEVEITWDDGKKETWPSNAYFAVQIIDDIA